MKNKVLIGVLTVLLVIGMVSCSMDEYAKLGEAMGKMGNNVYGIEPNMQKVNETTKQFDDKVTRNEAGDVEVELVKPAGLISSVAEIKNSPKKTEELKEQLDEPLAKDGVSGEEIQRSLQTTMENIISAMDVDPSVLASADDKVKSAYESVTNALNDIKDSISDNPTKADLAAVSIVNDLANTVKNIAENPDQYNNADGELDTEKIIEDANKALQALDALKVTSTAADLDILKDFNLASLFSSSGSGSKALSDDSSSPKDEDAMRKFMFSAIDSFTKMVVSVDGKFDEVKYNRFIFQMRAIRTAYETTAWLVTPSLAKGEDQFAVVDAIIDGKNIIGLGSFSANDLVLYAASVVFTECNKLPVKDGSKLSFKDAVKAYMEKDASVLEAGDLAKRFEDFEKFFNDVDLGKMEDYEDYLRHSAVTAVNTAAVILVDSGFDLKIIEKAGFKPEDGKSYGEELEKAFENLKNELGKNN